MKLLKSKVNDERGYTFPLNEIGLFLFKMLARIIMNEMRIPNIMYII